MSWRRIESKRDVIIFERNDEILAVACDSAASIGSKPMDKVKCDNYLLGYYTARVAVLELICINAKPICISCPSCLDDKATIEAVKGVKEFAKINNIIVSSEKNFEVVQSGFSVTAVGYCNKKDLRIKRTRKDDLLYLLGKPYVGDEVIKAHEKGLIPSLEDVKSLMKIKCLHEIIPVGSKGIEYESKVLAEDSNLKVKLKELSYLKKSAGPSTCLLFSASKDAKVDIKKEVKVIGRFLNVTAE